MVGYLSSVTILLEGPMFHWTMIVGGRVKHWQKIHKPHLTCLGEDLLHHWRSWPLHKAIYLNALAKKTKIEPPVSSCEGEFYLIDVFLFFFSSISGDFGGRNFGSFNEIWGCFWAQGSGMLPCLPPMLEWETGGGEPVSCSMSCSKHGLDAWLVVGCFKFRRKVHITSSPRCFFSNESRSCQLA